MAFPPILSPFLLFHYDNQLAFSAQTRVDLALPPIHLIFLLFPQLLPFPQPTKSCDHPVFLKLAFHFSTQID